MVQSLGTNDVYKVVDIGSNLIIPWIV